MTSHEHDAQRARVQADCACREVYPNRAAARAAAQERIAAVSIPHVVELDEPEAELLAAVLHIALAEDRLTADQARVLRELRDRVRPAFSAERRFRPEDMGGCDGLGT